MAEIVVKRYATALFDMAQEESSIDQYEAEAKLILESIGEEPDFMTLLMDDKISTEKKVELTSNIFAGKVADPIVGLMVLLIKKARQNFMLEIFAEFIEMVKAHKGILKAVVTSAIELKDEQLSRIKAELENNTKSQVEIELVVDETIIGGLIIKLGDQVVDASIKSEMQGMKRQLLDLRLA